MKNNIPGIPVNDYKSSIPGKKPKNINDILDEHEVLIRMILAGVNINGVITGRCTGVINVAQKELDKEIKEIVKQAFEAVEKLLKEDNNWNSGEYHRAIESFFENYGNKS